MEWLSGTPKSFPDLQYLRCCCNIPDFADLRMWVAWVWRGWSKMLVVALLPWNRTENFWPRRFRFRLYAHLELYHFAISIVRWGEATCFCKCWLCWEVQQHFGAWLQKCLAPQQRCEWCPRMRWTPISRPIYHPCWKLDCKKGHPMTLHGSFVRNITTASELNVSPPQPCARSIRSWQLRFVLTDFCSRNIANVHDLIVL